MTDASITIGTRQYRIVKRGDLHRRDSYTCPYSHRTFPGYTLQNFQLEITNRNGRVRIVSGARYWHDDGTVTYTQHGGWGIRPDEAAPIIAALLGDEQ